MKKMIVITGGAGFIGSTLAQTLIDEELIIIDKSMILIKDLIYRKFLSKISKLKGL